MMAMVVESIEERFIRELEQIASDFIKAFGLKFNRQVDGLSDPLLRWMDFRLRYVDPTPRRIIVSKAFPKKLPAKAGRALEKIAGRIAKGEDINPFQGAGLVLHHDTSGAKKQFRTDLLWAEWGITHLHLSNQNKKSETGYFVERSDWLLFALFTGCECRFIDVRPHNEPNVFSSKSLIEIVARSWPEWFEQFRLKGVHACDGGYTSDQMHQLRKAGVTIPVVFEGGMYLGPGMGITTAATSEKAGVRSDMVFESVQNLAQMVCNSEGQFQDFVRKKNVADPQFHLCITPEGMAIYEERADIAWVLPKLKPGQKENFLTQLREWMAPDWAVGQYVQANSSAPSRY